MPEPLPPIPSGPPPAEAGYYWEVRPGCHGTGRVKWHTGFVHACMQCDGKGYVKRKGAKPSRAIAEKVLFDKEVTIGFGPGEFMEPEYYKIENVGSELLELGQHKQTTEDDVLQ